VRLTTGERMAKLQDLDREVAAAVAAIDRPASVGGCFVHLASEVLATAAVAAAEEQVF